MNSIWQEFLRACGAGIENDLVTDFGDPVAERAAVGEQTIVAPLGHLGLLQVSGPDAAGFLHNQLTSDVKHLAIGSVQHSAWCSAKGRMLASFLVCRSSPEDYQLQLSADLLPLIHKRLQMFVLRSKVAITDRSGQRELIGLAGPQAELALQAAALPIPAAPLSASWFADGEVIRLAGSRFEIAARGDAVPAFWQSLRVHARPVGPSVWQWLDIQAGITLISERTREEFVPQMANFEQLGAVSFHKGCYPGQEIVARTQYLGKVKRHLYHAHSLSPMRAGQAIYSPANPQQPCGMIANGAPAPSGGHDALAIIQENFAAGGDLRLGTPGGAPLDIKPLSSPAA